ncbi:hypothetical protein IU450_28385 [Nocardia abscessus]|uniref:hypothetical protein n=1 Tax=Nocardia abscessus TaxID=120957 RepID=UPI00189388FA|nr:hypothetical protein [Nocardia abscessus]MBF6339778.1 hypothetical protein [Nocardia abscessus]
MSPRTVLTTLLYSITAVLIYAAIATLARRRAQAASHDVLTNYGTDRDDTPAPSTRGH